MVAGKGPNGGQPIDLRRLAIPASSVSAASYGHRDQTRRQHLAELMRTDHREANRRDEARLCAYALTDGLSEQHRLALDGLLTCHSDGITWIAWLRGAPQAPTARNMLGLIERLRVVRKLGLDRERERAVPAQAFDRLADEGHKMTAQHLGALIPRHRHAVLAATIIRL